MHCSLIAKLNNSFLFTHKWIWLFLSFYFLCFSSPLSFSTTASLSHHISMSRWAYSGVGPTWVWRQCGLLKLADDGLWFLPMMGCSSSVKMGYVLCVVVWWRKHWSSGSSGSVDLAAMVRCVLCFVCFDRCWSGFCCVCVFWWDFGRGFAQQLSGFWLGLIWVFFFFFFFIILIWVFVPVRFRWIMGSGDMVGMVRCGGGD